MERFGLRDDQWDRIKDILPGREGHVGGTAADNRLFVEAVLYRFRTGMPWRDLPARFGDWKSVHQRFQPLGEKRSFRAYFPTVGERCRQRIHDDRRHHCARSSTQRRRPKKDGDQAIGRSRGGLTTKIHALVDALGNPANLMLTAGQIHDLACAQDLIENADPEALIADKAYDADASSTASQSGKLRRSSRQKPTARPSGTAISHFTASAISSISTRHGDSQDSVVGAAVG